MARHFRNRRPTGAGRAAGSGEGPLIHAVRHAVRVGTAVLSRCSSCLAEEPAHHLVAILGRRRQPLEGCAEGPVQPGGGRGRPARRQLHGPAPQDRERPSVQVVMRGVEEAGAGLRRLQLFEFGLQGLGRQLRDVAAPGGADRRPVGAVLPAGATVPLCSSHQETGHVPVIRTRRADRCRG